MGNTLRYAGFFLIGAALLFWVGCSPPADLAPSPSVPSVYTGAGPLEVVCTTGMVADLVKQVGGPRVKVTQLMGAGVDPHLYKVSPGDVRRLAQADAIFYSGRNLEGKMGEVFARMASQKPTVAVTSFVADREVLAEPGHGQDPHLWFDVALWAKGIDVVRDTLAKFDPSHAAEYSRRAAAHRAELDQLDAYVRAQIQTIPPGQRVLVTAHDAFRYFGRAYGLEVRGIQGISTESEASVRSINELVDLLVARKIKAVFVESSVAEKNVQALVEGCRARGHALQIGGELYSDAMGQPGTPAGSYVGMVRHNVDTIVKALR